MIEKDTYIGRFRIIESLGKGGMGNVYLAEDALLERTVAIKSLPARALREHFRDRFLKEARTLSKLDHPNICRIYDFVQAQDRDFLVLEFIQGRTLYAALEDKPSFEEKLRWAIQIAGVLKATHAKRITHRDLKPENVMITRSGQIKVLDFGLALSEDPPVEPDSKDESAELDSLSTDELPQDDVFSEMDTHGSISGSLRYMSPEQARAELVTQKSDLYSFGVMLYEWFSGSSPYAEDLSYPALLFQVGQAKMRPIEPKGVGLPQALVQLIQELMQVDANARPEASEVKRRLERILEAPMQRRRVRKRLMWGAAGVLAIVLTLFVVWRLAFPAPLFNPGEIGRVGLLPLSNETGSTELSWVELGLMEMVGHTLEQVDNVTFKTSQEVLEVIQAMGLEPTQTLSTDLVTKLNRTLGTDVLIAGTLKQNAGQFALQYDIHHSSGESERRHITGVEVVELANTMANRLAIRFSAQEAFRDIRNIYSDNPFLNRVFAMGVQHLHVRGAEEARAFFEVCLTKDPDFLWARVYLALCDINAGDWESGCRELETLLERATEEDNTRMIITVLENLASVTTDQGKFDEAESYLERALALCDASKLRSERGKINRILGKMHYLKADYDHGQAFTQTAIDIFHELGDAYYETESVNVMGSIFLGRGDIEAAKAQYQKAADLARRHHLPAAESRALGNLGNIALFLNRHEEAQRLLSQSLQYVEKTGDKRNTLILRNSLAVIAMHLKQVDRAESLFLEVLQGAKAMGLAEVEATAYLNLADIHLRRHEAEAARPLIDSALDLETWITDSFYAAYYNAYHAYERGALEEARRLIRQARKKAPGGQWTEENEILYQCIHDAVDQGRRLPVPFSFDP